jgi:glucokinase
LCRDARLGECDRRQAPRRPEPPGPIGPGPFSITFRSLVEGVRASDPVCLEILEEFVRDLGATIVTAVHAYNPSVVVLAGGPMAASDLFLADVQAYVDRYAFIFPKGRRVELRRARLEAHAGVLGAAALMLSQLEEDPA